jgi:hypothetical protein
MMATTLTDGHRHASYGVRLGRFTPPRARGGKAMVVSMFYGWKIVIVCFLLAFFSFGIGFYGPGVYIVS